MILSLKYVPNHIFIKKKEAQIESTWYPTDFKKPGMKCLIVIDYFYASI